MIKNESGRSMVEMLGVLAIIGVLSVGGIAGYTTAMRSYKANEIVNATSMLYMLGLSSNAGAGTATLTYTGSIGGSLSALHEISYNAGAISIQIDDDAVCNQVQTKLGSKATGSCSEKTGGYYVLNVTFGGGVVEALYDDFYGKECAEDGETCYVKGCGDCDPEYNADYTIMECQSGTLDIAMYWSSETDGQPSQPSCSSVSWIS